jgi:hypothetical protein
LTVLWQSSCPCGRAILPTVREHYHEIRPAGQGKFCSARLQETVVGPRIRKPEHWKLRAENLPVCGEEFISAKKVYRPVPTAADPVLNRGRAVKGGEADG